MTGGWPALWSVMPTLALCVGLLLVLRRQVAWHRRNMAKLDALERSLDALNADEATRDRPASRKPSHDPVGNGD